MAIAQTLPEATTTVTQLNWLQAVVLGAVQGLTEFIPISSTAHLKAVPVFLGWGDPGSAFAAVIQLGSIAAVLWYFWRDIADLTTEAFKALRESNYKNQSLRIVLGIAVGTLPIVLFGFSLKIFVPDFDNSPLRSMTAIAIASIVMAILLGIAEQLGQRQKGFDDLNAQTGILMGLAQALALIPGVSRSGSTITAGLFLGLERSTAARFSFLLGIPAITLAGIVEFISVMQDGLSRNQGIPLLVGTVSSAVFSYLAIAWLIEFLKRQSTWVFVWYRLLFGLVILGAIAIGWL
ncbi:MAG: undecaprenyl-diphosphate phosphatase [Jaaginema sp. PMC 1079.18]|nr:undecaprenyl-diphosphate phosphatase [Jaaginema sp. PMC 1080.18]MEC4852452.1 undecaprenyl-diphosphate phosphatase [Jaaginema sp. PMC 1079.18]MEC4867939.1 undecaprenyl-diphosphate phosphatase [Jaaginema sp. PMC 1078.18]